MAILSGARATSTSSSAPIQEVHSYLVVLSGSVQARRRFGDRPLEKVSCVCEGSTRSTSTGSPRRRGAHHVISPRRGLRWWRDSACVKRSVATRWWLRWWCRRHFLRTRRKRLRWWRDSACVKRSVATRWWLRWWCRRHFLRTRRKRLRRAGRGGRSRLRRQRRRRRLRTDRWLGPGGRFGARLILRRWLR